MKVVEIGWEAMENVDFLCICQPRKELREMETRFKLVK